MNPMRRVRVFISYICVVVLLSPSLSYAQYGTYSSPSNARYGTYTSSIKKGHSFNQDDLKFIVAYKSYIKALLHLQAAETKKKLICLGYESLTGLDLRNNPELKQLVQNHKNSQECKKFLEKDVQALIYAYSEMRIHLALHQSSRNEIFSLTNRPGSLGNFKQMPIDCESFQAPLKYQETNFCFNQLITILDSTPRHILRKFSVGFLDDALDFVSGHKLPKVTTLPPLMWEEVKLATEIFRGHFTDNPVNINSIVEELSTDHEQEDLALLKGQQTRWTNQILKQKQLERDTKAQLGNYYSANAFQAQGSYVFSDYPENSAPRVYMELLSKHPVLAFYDPKYEAANLNCESVDIRSQNLTALCYEYLRSLPRGFESGLSFSLSLSKDVEPRLALAYSKMLTTNQLLIESLDIKYNTENLFNEKRILIEKDISRYISNWSDLISMDVALKNFLEMFPEYKGLEGNFVSAKQRQDTITLTLMIGAAVGAGFACGLMGGWPLLLCLGASGIGVNTAFYADSYHRHNDLLIKYFSSSESETANGIKLGLVEFESYKSEVQSLFMDTMFLGVGTSAGRMKKLLFELTKRAH